MTTEVFVSIIAFSGVILSALVSYLTSQRKIRIELENFQAQIEHTYATRLFEQRFAVYPILFELISSFIKKIRYYTITKSDLDEFVSKIEEWDNKNSIYASAMNVKYLYRLIRAAHDVQGKTKVSPTKDVLIEKLIPRIADLELGMKTELGVFARHGYQNPKTVKTLDEILGQASNEYSKIR